MMLACLLMFSIPAAVEVTLAPDQPMPFVYCDDPLILEVYSEEEGQVSGTLSFLPSHHDKKIEVALKPFYVHAKTGYWYAVQDAPQERGYFTVEINLTCGDTPYQKALRYCRIDRPASLRSIPVYAHCGGGRDTCSLASVRSVGIETIHFAAGNEYLEALSEETVRLGLHIVLSLAPDDLRRVPDYLKPVIDARCEHILRFETGCGGIEAECGALMESFRTTVCPASMSVVVKDANDFARIMGQAPRMPARHVSLVSDRWPNPAEVQRIRYIAAQYGLEGTQIHVSCPGWYPRADEQACSFLYHFFQHRAAGASDLGLNAALVADDMGVQEIMAYLNGLALQFSGQSFVGGHLADGSAKTLLFRKDAHWMAVIWSDKKGDTAGLSVDGAINLALSDALGNPIKLAEPGQGGLLIDCGPIPVYLTGTGGALLGRAAVNRLQEQTEYFLSQTELRGSLSQEVIEMIQKIGAEPSSSASRLRFLELLRMLPWLEEQWHTRQLPKHVAVPTIMLISDMAKSMALIEEDRGELFLEPITDTLGRTEEFQSLYLTGSAGSAKARERGDWILGEVRRLVEESESLEKSGRKIEAAAIAALAEARGQCLKPAAQAEIEEEASGIVPLPAVPPVVEQQPAELPQPEVPAAPAKEETPKKTDKTEKDKVDKDKVEKKPETEVEEAPEKEEAKEVSEKAGEGAEGGETVHVVVSGDNPYNIAKKYGVKLDDMLEWNNLTRKSVLQINQKLVIRPKKSD